MVDINIYEERKNTQNKLFSLFFNDGVPFGWLGSLPDFERGRGMVRDGCKLHVS